MHPGSPTGWSVALRQLSGISLLLGGNRFAAFIFIGALTLVAMVFVRDPLLLLYPPLFVLTLSLAKYLNLMD
jgi:hypothetical protein